MRPWVHIYFRCRKMFPGSPSALCTLRKKNGLPQNHWFLSNNSQMHCKISYWLTRIRHLPACSGNDLTGIIIAVPIHGCNTFCSYYNSQSVIVAPSMVVWKDFFVFSNLPFYSIEKRDMGVGHLLYDLMFIFLPTIFPKYIYFHVRRNHEKVHLTHTRTNSRRHARYHFRSTFCIEKLHIIIIVIIIIFYCFASHFSYTGIIINWKMRWPIGPLRHPFGQSA